MPAQLVESVVCHQSRQAVMFNDVVTQMKEEIDRVKQQMVRMEEEKNNLKMQVEKVTKYLQIQHCVTICPLDFTMTNFAKQKRENTEWKSSPCFTYMRGYKLHFGVYPNGQGHLRNRFVLIYLVLMKGEFDYELEWPFTGKLQFQLLNQDQNEGHNAQMIRFRSGFEGNRVTQGKESEKKLYVYLLVMMNYNKNT